MASSQNIDEDDESIVNTGGNYSGMSSHSLVADDSMKWKEPVGCRFKPTDEVLVEVYLFGKVSGRTDGPIFKLIKEENIYKYEPSDLSRRAYAFGDGMMYFFTPIYKKYGKGTNIDRIAPGGCWKITGKSTGVCGKDGKPIAKRTSLAYYKNDPKSGKPVVKTQWLMREYMLLENDSQSNENPKTSAPSLTLCVVYLHENKRKRCQSETPHMVEESSHVFANTAANLDYQQNLSLSSAENSGKRYRRSSDLHENKFDDFSMFFNENGGQASCSNIPPTFSSISYPALTPEQGLPSPNSCNNMLNMLTGFSGTTDPNALIANHHQSPVSEFHTETLRFIEEWLQIEEADESLNQVLNENLNVFPSLDPNTN